MGNPTRRIREIRIQIRKILLKIALVWNDDQNYLKSGKYKQKTSEILIKKTAFIGANGKFKQKS
jgi:hypothetical protein